MKSLSQSLKGVTAGGIWHQPSRHSMLLAHGGRNGNTVAIFHSRPDDAAFAARACSTWPVLVTALQVAIEAIENCDRHVGLLAGERNSLEQARAALADALSDS